MAVKVLTTTEGAVGTSFDLRIEDGETIQATNADPATLIENVAFPTFVFSPSNPAPAGNVYSDWATLQTAYAKVAGPKWIEFDPTFAAITIPAGAWSLEDCTCTASKATTTGSVTVTWAAGASFTSAHLRLQSIIFVCSSTINNPGASGHTIYVLDDASTIQGSAGQSGVPLIVSGTLTLFLNNGSTLGDSASHSNVISVAGTGILAAAFFGASVALDHWLTGVNTANAVVAADATCTASNVTDGAMAPVFELFVNGNAFTFRPGGTLAPGLGVYTTWTGLATALAFVQGVKHVQIDNSLGVCHITAGGPYSLDGCIFWGQNAGSSTTEELIVDTGASFTAAVLESHNVAWQNNAASPFQPNTAASGGSLFKLYGGTMRSLVGTPFIETTGTGAILIELFENSQIAGANACVQSDAGGVTNIRVFDGSTVVTNTLSGLGTIGVFLSAEAIFNRTQLVTTLTITWMPIVNTVQAQGNTGTGTGTVTVTTGNIARKKSGQMLVMTSIAGVVTSAGATVTAQLLRDATPIGQTQAVSPLSVNDVFALDPLFIDTAPDNANHTYQLSVAASAGNLTVAATSAQIVVTEL